MNETKRGRVSESPDSETIETKKLKIRSPSPDYGKALPCPFSYCDTGMELEPIARGMVTSAWLVLGSCLCNAPSIDPLLPKRCQQWESNPYDLSLYKQSHRDSL